MLRTLLLSAAGCLFVLAPTAAQQAGPTQENHQDYPPRVTIHFEGGTLRTYVDLLRAKCPDINVVVSEDAADLTIQPIDLRNVAPKIAFVILDRLPPRQFRIDELGGKSPVVVISALADSPSRLMTQVYSIRGLLEGRHRIPIEQVMAVIESALSLDAEEGGPKPNIRAHNETGMLMMRASERDLQTVMAVLEQLRVSSREAHDLTLQEEAKDQAKQIGDYEHRLAEMQGLLDEMQARSVKMQEELVRRERMIAELEARLEHERAVKPR